jgi:GNAT superfamily N-acetyltransferase
MALETHPLEKEDLYLLPSLQPEGWGNILPAHEIYLKSSCCFPLKFTDDNKLVGIGTIIIHHDSAWLAHIIVHPGLRKKGIGQLITKTLMDAAFSKHCDLLTLIATDLGEPVYSKLGFETDTEYVFVQERGYTDAKPGPTLKQPGNPELPVNLNQSDNLNQPLNIPLPGNFTQPGYIMPYQPSLLAELLALDKYISGEDRTVYLLDHLDQGMLYFNNDVLEGFYLPAAGEGMISAITATAGIALMDLRIKTKDVFIFPVGNIVARQYFERQNLSPFRTEKRMVFGKRRNWHSEHIYNRIGGNLG